jgi:Cytochrome c7 and related cytochrome c
MQTNSGTFRRTITSHLFALCWAVVLVLYGSSVQAKLKPTACVLCHEFMDADLGRPVKEWKGSIHQQNSITCDLCHGGNPDVDVQNIKQLPGQEFGERMSRAMSTSQGFVGKPSGRKLFALCGRCHSTSVDRYEKSLMGKAYLEKKGGPSCVKCHHAHRNVMPEIPKVCESCHKDTEGFDQIDPMDVTESTVKALSGIRIKLAQAKTIGKEPPFIPEFPEDLGAFQIGFVAFGAVLVLFCIGYLVYIVLERRR